MFINDIAKTTNMGKISFIITFLLISIIAEAQVQHRDTMEYYMPIKTFRESLTDTTHINDIHYIIKDGDSLVPYRRSFGKGNPELKKVKFVLKDKTFLNIYKPIAYVSVGESDPRHRFWNEDIVIYFGETVPRKHQRFLKRFIRNNLSDINHLKIKTTNTIEHSNFIIYYDGGFEYSGRYKRYFKKRKNLYTYWTGSDIDKAVLKLIPNFYNSDKALLGDLVRGFVANLGYFNQSSQLGCDSVFSNCHGFIESLSAIDKEILEYHYSRGFCVGMDLNSFEEQDALAREFYKYNEEGDFYVLFRKDRF